MKKSLSTFLFSSVISLFLILPTVPINAHAFTLVHQNGDPDLHVVQILDLEIDGIFYNVNFHTDETFLNLWDVDNGNAPAFFYTVALRQDALNAAHAVMNALGDDATTNDGYFSDSFFLPHQFVSGGGVDGFFDQRRLTDEDEIGVFQLQNNDSHSVPYVSFHTPIPEPSTMILFCIGLIGFTGVSRKKF